MNNNLTNDKITIKIGISGNGISGNGLSGNEYSDFNFIENEIDSILEDIKS